jgi:glycine hydroxymethyltransferase
MAGKAVAFAEALEFGKDYAAQVIKNAKIFAEALNDAGFKVLGESRGYTQSHQIAVNVLDYSDGGKVEAELEKANIIVNRQLIPGEIATFIKQIIIEKKDPKKVLPKVKSWRKDYQKVKYCFDSKLGAYEYVKLR